MSVLTRAGLLCLLACGLAGWAGAEEIGFRYDFEKDTAGFTVVAGKGAVAQVNSALRVTAEAANVEVRVASPTFAVKPWTIYRLTDTRTAATGVDVRAIAQYADGEGWRDVTLTSDGDGGTFGTLPNTQRARLVYCLRATDKATERQATLDTIVVAVKGAIVKERSKNLFADPSLEAATGVPPTGWDTWVNAPQKAELGTLGAHDGKQFYRVTGNTVYLILPMISVQPNRLYRIRFWLRGEGQVYFGMHKLSEKMARIGWAPAISDGLLLKPDTWQRVEMLATADSDAVKILNPYMNMKGACTIEIDDLEAIAVDEAAVKTP